MCLFESVTKRKEEQETKMNSNLIFVVVRQYHWPLISLVELEDGYQ